MCVARGFFRCGSGRAGPEGRGQGLGGTGQRAGTGWVCVRKKPRVWVYFFLSFLGSEWKARWAVIKTSWRRT